jgi:hypothetical protein
MTRTSCRLLCKNMADFNPKVMKNIFQTQFCMYFPSKMCFCRGSYNNFMAVMAHVFVYLKDGSSLSMSKAVSLFPDYKCMKSFR